MSDCDCDIRTTIERLEDQRLIEPLSALDALLLYDLDKTDKDSFLFYDHMQLEEDRIFPFLDAKDRAELMMHHTMIRNFKRRGVPVPDKLFNDHKMLEKRLFFRVGR